MRASPCTPPRPAGRLVALLAPMLALAVLACREDGESPTGPARSPAAEASLAGELSFRQVSVGHGRDFGHGHVCGVTTDSRAYCWGVNQAGQLGVGTTTGPQDCGHPCSTRPVQVHGGRRFLQVSAGGNFTCGITTDHRAFCWGENDQGQLGDGTQETRLTPAPIAITRRFRHVTAGQDHACAITDFDVAFCWGENSSNTLGDGTATRRLSPVRVAGGLQWRDLSAAHTHTCGVTTANLAYCWGSNSGRKLGDGSASVTNRSAPSPVAGSLPFRHIVAGYNHTCAVTTEHAAYCWGENGFGQLGDGTFGGESSSSPTPTPVFGTRRYDQLSAGTSHTCGVTRAGRGFCWGFNGIAGQLGNGTTTISNRPSAIAGNLLWVQVSAQYQVGCGVTEDHRAHCWGDNGTGQLGNGTQVPSRVPVAVAAPSS